MLEMGRRIFLQERVRKKEELHRHKEQSQQERREEEGRRQNELNREIMIELERGRRMKESHLKHHHDKGLREKLIGHFVQQRPH